MGLVPLFSLHHPKVRRTLGGQGREGVRYITSNSVFFVASPTQELGTLGPFTPEWGYSVSEL